MAITRIKNNQITDATINASTKLVDRTVTGLKLAEALVYDSDLTVTGNLVVQGVTTTIDTTNTTIEDPIMVLGAQGTAGVDIGFVGVRTGLDNVALVWDESAGEFKAAYTESAGSDAAITNSPAGYANIHVATLTASAIAGDITLQGQLSDSVLFINATGKIATSSNIAYADASGTLEITGSATVDDVSINGTTITVDGNGSLVTATGTNGNIYITPDGTGQTFVKNLVLDGLTANRVLVTDTLGGTATSENLTFDGLLLGLTGNIDVSGMAGIADITIDTGLVQAAQGLSLVATGNLVLDPSANVLVDTAVSTQVFYAGPAKELIGSANFTFDGSQVAVTGALKVDNVTVDGDAIASAGPLTLAAALDQNVVLDVSGNGVVVVDDLTVDGTTITTSVVDGSIILDPNGNGVVSVSGAVIQNVAAPVLDTDAANKAYVDFVVGDTTDITADDSGVAVIDDGITAGSVVTTVDNVAVVTTTATSTVFAQPVTADNVTITGSTVNADTGNLVLDSTSGTVNVADATQYEVFVAGAAGALEGSADFTYDGANLAVTGNVVATGQVSAASLVVDNVTVDGDTITGAASTTVAATGNIVLDPTANVIVDTATANYVFVAGANKELAGSAAFTFNGSNLAVTGNAAVTGEVEAGSVVVDNVTIDNDEINAVGDLAITSTSGNISITPDVANGVVSITNLTIAGHTASRVVFTDLTGQMVTDGNLQFDGDDFTVTGSLTVDNVIVNSNTINTIGDNLTLRIDSNGTGEFYVDRNVTVSGNLSVLGTTTTVDSTVVTIQDPIIELGRGAGNTPLTTNDGKDRGIRLWYYDPTALEEQSAWMGYDHPTEEFRYFNDAIITDESVTGVLGTVNVGKVIVDTITIDNTSLTAAGALQLISGLDTDLSLTATGLGKVVVPTGDQFRVADLGEDRIVFTTTGGELITDADLTFDGGNLGLVGKLTVDNVTIDNDTVSSASALTLTSATGEDINITPGTGGVTNIAGLTVGGVTANRVVVSDAAGALVGDDDFTYNVTTNALTLVGSAKVDNVTIDGAIISVDTDATVAAAGNLVLDPTANVIVDTATATAVFYAGANKELLSSGNFTFDGSNVVVSGKVSIDDVTIDGSTVSSAIGLALTSGANGNIDITPNGTGTVNISNLAIAGLEPQRVVITSSTGALAEVDNFTFDGTALSLAGSLAVDNVTIDADSVAFAADATVSAVGNIVLDPGANVIVDTAVATRIFYAGTNKELSTSANFTYDGANLVLTGGFNATGAVDVTGSFAVDNVSIDTNTIESDTALNITSGADGNINIVPNGNGVVNIDGLVISGLAANSIVITDATGQTATSTALTFDGATVSATADVVVTGSLAVDNVSINGDTITGAASTTVATTGNLVLDPTANVIVDTATAQQIFYAGAAKELVGSSNFTYDGTEVKVTGNFEATGISVLGNVTVTGDDITTAGTMLTVNAAGADIDFQVSSDTIASALFVDGASGSVVVGSNVPTAEVSFKVDATDAMMVPVGLTAERPAIPVAGMLRFNTNLGDLELYDGDSWNSTSTEFTLIGSEVFNGDGSTATFTLSSAQTTASCIVSINGVIQFPTLAYAVSGTSLSFTEAPVPGDVIEVRKLTTTKSFALEVVNTAETARVTASESAAQIDVTGNLVPTTNVTYDLGTAAFRWRDLYLSGTTIDLGGIRLKNAAGTFTVVDGTDTPVPVNLDVDGGEY